MNRISESLSGCVRTLENLHLRYDADVGVMLVQVDQMARINNSAGTAAGDAVLDEIGRRLESFATDEFGQGSRVDRIDGPRFLIVPAVPLSLGALRAQERALHVALAEPMVGDPKGRLAIRIAAALIARDEPVVEQLRTASDQLARPASARDGAMVMAALSRGEVVIHYQPQYDVATGAMSGVEALLRWQHPELGLLGAGPLVTAARAARLERELTEHAHHVALAEIAAWPEALANIRVSLNITAADLGDPEFAERFAGMARQANVDPARLTLELTEQAMLSDPASAAEQLAQIRAFGCAIAIDDFGTGYSSLSLLARLPIDYLKIDSGFTRTIDDSDRDRIVVRAIVDLARALGLLVVAEGIEKPQQLERLKELGVATWQGFLKSGPVAGDQLPGLLAA
ncbi:MULTISPECIES: GGDEF domain-containing phosphodiesterase [unclassified Sphingopyxis]|uniref:GGDEF domain-containing phosphodiesterase n=1 Tax=unclassified Sphingopyxis TaxID=2614943 RepID=UPI000731B596|nr:MULTISPECIES: GGDEF domain-containing phosphodiesterase [unclassified Sphingopyxis]KTE25535.1 diguanylate cyclase [Sphingopyxis sp. H057]KTE53554.1 diguanylate cyclase [Sphingopyxis sp. H073]KTE56147.1 diguanylate cyclase [Sphingopyxis sp. H071]KTE61840.1 diguanylate cyclase [Sphingopyxis sp. H107]KTE67113.1 diguanylate cyclase [Sphingopyxis sp. H100]